MIKNKIFIKHKKFDNLKYSYNSENILKMKLFSCFSNFFEHIFDIFIKLNYLLGSNGKKKIKIAESKYKDRGSI